VRSNIPLLIGVAMASLGNNRVPDFLIDDKNYTKRDAIKKRKNKKSNKAQRKSRKVNRRRK